MSQPPSDFESKQDSSGTTYASTDLGLTYISLNKHRDYKNDKVSSWSKLFKRDEEFTLFCSSYKGNWCGHSGDYWGILSDGRPLGHRGECISKFPESKSSIWHGYPVHLSKERPFDCPDSKVLDAWEEQYVIDWYRRQEIARFRPCN